VSVEEAGTAYSV